MTHFSLLSSKMIPFSGDRRGNTSVLFAVAVLPVLGAVGAGIDYSRYVTTSSTLQAEADRLALAAQLQQITSDDRLKSFVQSQITDPAVTIVGNPDYSSADGSMCLTLTKRVPTVVMQVIRFAAMNPTATACSITGGGGAAHYEIALALDNTGSMSVSDSTTGRSKIQSEITAAKNFVDQMFTAVGSQHLDISVVPFTTAVNVGTQYANASWMDTSGRSSIHWENFPKQRTTAENDWNPQSRFDLFTEINQSWGGCVEERPQPYTLTDDPASSGTPDTLYVPLFAPDESDSPSVGYRSYNSYLHDNGGFCAAGDAYATADSTGTFKDGTRFFGDGQQKLCKYGIKYTASNPTPTQQAGSAQSGIQSWYSSNPFSIPLFSSASAVASSIISAGTYSVGGQTVSFCNNGLLSPCYNLFGGQNSLNWHSASLPLNTVLNPQGTTSANTTVAASNYSATSTMTAWSGSGWNYGGNGWGSGSGWGWAASAGFQPSTTNPGYTAGGASSNLHIGSNQFNLGGGANSGCDATLQPLRTLSNDQSAIKNMIGTLKADGATNLVSGLMWAWRTISPNGPFRSNGVPRNYQANSVRKILVFMTDGFNNWEPDDSRNGGVYSAFGYYRNDRLGALTVNGSSTHVNSSNNRQFLDAAFLQACTNAKAAGIEVYTVAFSIPNAPIDTEGKNLLPSCATDMYGPAAVRK